MKKVLIVDDELSVRKLLVATLRKEQVVVLQAVNGSEALSMTLAEHPDLVVLDVILPGEALDGFEVCSRLKKDPVTADCKVLLISGAHVLDDERVAASGADGFLSKPFNPIKLRLRINHLLGL